MAAISCRALQGSASVLKRSVVLSPSPKSVALPREACAAKERVRVAASAQPAEGSSSPVQVKNPYESDTEQQSLKSGEWASNFSQVNYEDLSKYLEEAEQKPVVTQDPSSPILPDASHAVVSGEWSENLSILSYEDLSSYFQKSLFKEGAKPDSLVADVMIRQVRTAFPENTVAEIAHHLKEVSGLPVVDKDLKCVGMLTKSDVEKVGDANAKVQDLMTSPPTTVMRTNKTVLFAATLMLKNKTHRIPVVNEEDKLVGIVTRTDIFTVLEANN